tara:strand:+ start:169 stop:504 length:336 start_codon:yes stop_codon:yes gene_type:complete
VSSFILVASDHKVIYYLKTNLKTKPNMLTKKFSHILQFNPMKSHDGVDARGRMEKIKFREFKKSSKTMQKIREAGLENEIDDCIEVEATYKIKKIVGYGATSVVYKAYNVK